MKGWHTLGQVWGELSRFQKPGRGKGFAEKPQRSLSPGPAWSPSHLLTSIQGAEPRANASFIQVVWGSGLHLRRA